MQRHSFLSFVCFAFLLSGCPASSTPGGADSGTRPRDDAASSCDDRVQNGGETGTDCGGGCAGCPDGVPCAVDEDCLSRICGIRLTCVAPTCMDRVHNGDESDVDCGGSCAACPNDRACGDFRMVRQRCDELRDAEDPEVRAAAEALRSRTDVDPVQVVVVLACFALVGAIATVWIL